VVVSIKNYNAFMFYFKAALSVVFTASEQRYKKRKSYFSENSLAYLKNSFHFCREIKSSPILNPSQKGKDFKVTALKNVGKLIVKEGFGTLPFGEDREGAKCKLCQQQLILKA
jgi:hypothetical protein